MTSSKLQDLIAWAPTKRHDLVSLLSGASNFVGPHNGLPLNSWPAGVDALVGHPKHRNGGRNYVIAIDDATSKEVLSWLHSFAAQITPVSCYARVVLASDIAILTSGSGIDLNPRTSAIWSSITLGELLVYRDGSRSLDIPLSWVPLSYSAAEGRTSMHYGSSMVLMEACLKRLEVLHRDPDFAKRAYSPTAIAPIWRVAVDATDSEAIESPREAKDVLYDIFLYRRQNSTETESLIALDGVLGIEQLRSDSIEIRVEGFDFAIKRIREIYPEKGILDDRAALGLAAAAFLVGRGTSHLSLLDDLADKSPLTYIWFGLIAGLGGPKFWTPTWLQYVRKIEQQLLPEASIQIPSSFDICWCEYDWLRQTYGTFKASTDLIKMHAKALLVEIFPGIVSQFRYAASLVDSNRAQFSKMDVPSSFDADINAVREVVKKLNGLLGMRDVGLVQQTLGLEGAGTTRKKTKKNSIR